MPRLLVEKGPDRGKSVTIVAGAQIVAGRDKEANLQLSDTMASRRHFLIASKGSIFGLKDLQSANGTLVNGRKAEGAHRLAYGDSIQVGETLISWLPDEQTDTQGGLIGQQIGGYRIEERLGRGAMGTVYKATQLSLGRTVALKVLSQDLVKDEKFCEMFVKEARAAGSLNHPNIIQVYDVGDEGGQYFFSMEFASKGSVLEELGNKKSIGMARAVRVIKDACSALDYAERKGLVHRDIKPDNLMVTEDNTVKLGDLGLAMSTQELQAEQDGVFGTPHYIAPEQAMGKPIDHRADIYALGATFYRMLSGRTLFTGATVKEILKKQVREPHTAITESVPDCPQAISRIIDRMLAKNPAERYQHAQDVLTDLSDWENLAARKAVSPGAAFAERPTGLSAEQSQQLAQFNANKKLLVAGIVALAAIVAAAFSVWYFVIRDDSPVFENNSAPISPVGNNAPAGNSGGTTLPPEVVSANETLKLELEIAERQVKKDGESQDSLAKAIAALEDALAKNPKGSVDVRTLVVDRVASWKTRLSELSQSAGAVRTEWDETWRAAEEQIEAFHYKAGRGMVESFIHKYERSTNESVLEVVAEANRYFKDEYPRRVQSHLDEFRRGVLRDIDDAKKDKSESEIAAVAEGALERVRNAQTACDDDDQRNLLRNLGDNIARELKILKDKAEKAEERALDEAFKRCSAALNQVLDHCRADVARGDFKKVQQRINDFKLGNDDYIAHKDKPRFAPIVADLQRRLDQLTLQHRALLELVDAKPSIIDIDRILKDHPWPDDVAGFMGGAKTYLKTIRVKSDIDGQQFTLELSDERKFSAGDFDTREERLALAGAIAHLVMNHEPSLKEMMRPVSKGGPPALVGLFAWMADLEAYDSAFKLIDYAWRNLPPSDAGYALTREYYAYGLLGMADALNSRGDKSGASALLDRVDKEFADTRAGRGRK